MKKRIVSIVLLFSMVLNTGVYAKELINLKKDDHQEVVEIEEKKENDNGQKIEKIEDEEIIEEIEEKEKQEYVEIKDDKNKIENLIKDILKKSEDLKNNNELSFTEKVEEFEKLELELQIVKENISEKEILEYYEEQYLEFINIWENSSNKYLTSNIIEGINYFPDDNFRKAVVKVHQLPGKEKEGFPITKEEVENLKKDHSNDLQNLDFSSLDIKDTTGINNMYLGTIDLSDNDIKNFEYVAPSSFNGMPFNRSPRAINLNNNDNLEKVYVLGSLSEFGNIYLDNTSVDISNDTDFQVKFSQNSTARNLLSINNLKKEIPKNFDFNTIGNYANGKKYEKGKNIKIIYASENNISEDDSLIYPENINQLYLDNNNYEKLPNFTNNENLWIISMDNNRLKELDLKNLVNKSSFDTTKLNINGNKLLNYIENDNLIYEFNKEYIRQEDECILGGRNQYIFDLENTLKKKRRRNYKKFDFRSCKRKNSTKF